MKILQDYTVSDRLRLSDTGPEAAVGDLVKLFLNTQANPAFPAFIYGVVQHPIVRVSCNNSTAYDISYNETDLLGSAAFIRPGDVIDATITVGPADHAVALNRSSADAHPISAITGLVTALAGKVSFPGVTSVANANGEPEIRFSGNGINTLSLKNTYTGTEAYSVIAFQEPGAAICEKGAVGVGKSNASLYPWRSVYLESFEGLTADQNILPIRLVQTKMTGGYQNFRRIEISSSGTDLGDVTFYSGTGPSYPNETIAARVNNDGTLTLGSSDARITPLNSSGAMALWGSNLSSTGSFIAAVGSTNVTPHRQGGVEIYSDYNGGGGRISFGSHNNGTGFREVGFFAKNTGDFNVVAGKIINPTMPAFANDAAADAALASGTLYKLTGSRQVFQRP